ncbi:GDSL-like Lipase/Acylhydrolase family protein [Rathayibacter oskolensis]|uniref:GDSL-like Lipase/Acylhydrolase family protein n=1 Tax=Rathayibacter oskolensis TaxID=1891671 RepID=A0A1X7MV14_9MICO|nr:SGNH/GDSL hydrolase family protein [Rathayibacter oskolensis]SMH28158.1 GDSL-like Lipase/Acylhydrolase family protein [Rathayibacter oskolensis]
MTIRRLSLIAAASVVAVLGSGVALTAARAADHPRYWRELAARPAAPDALRMVAFGDSCVVGVGALDPRNSLVGRIARDLEQRTGRSVHVTNLAAAGATTDEILRDQVQRADLATADLIVVATPSDLESRVPLPDYRRDLLRFTALLPADRTVISDLPLEPGRNAYQSVLADVADERRIRRADFASVFTGPGRRLDIFSLLPPHLNDRGYRYWSDAFQRPTREIVPGG